MANEVITPAYWTKLGNLTAKSVLVLLADESNTHGFSWPSIERIALKTEVSKRTVLRMLQVLADIGLLGRTTHLLANGKMVPAYQICVEKLGTDQRQAFEAAYKKAQSKHEDAGVAETAGDNVAETEPASVVATVDSVAATQESVAATVPPHPHIGGPLTDPSVTQTPPNPLVTEGEDEFTAEQLAHLNKLGPHHPDRCCYERSYREMNQREREELAKAAAELRARAEEMARMQAAMPTVHTARGWVMRECGWVEDCRRHGIGAVVEAAIELETQAGKQPWETGAAIARAWKKYQANGEWISPRYGPLKFVKLGIWRDERGWGWKVEEMRRNAEARVGSKG